MEQLVELILRLMGAPLACITPTVAAVTIGGWAYSLYKEAKENAERTGGSLWNEGKFILGISLAICALSFIWTAWNVLLAIVEQNCIVC